MVFYGCMCHDAAGADAQRRVSTDCTVRMCSALPVHAYRKVPSWYFQGTWSCVVTRAVLTHRVDSLELDREAPKLCK